MSSARSRSSNPVSLFPFLAVLMCTMGALILLLIVTSRRIRREAVARSLPVQTAPPPPTVERPAKPKTVARTRPAPFLSPPERPDVVPHVPALRTVVKAPGETDRIIASHHAAIIRTNAARKTELARLQAELDAIVARQVKLTQQLDSARSKQAASQAELQRLASSQSTMASKAAEAAEKYAQLKGEISKSSAAVATLRRKLALLNMQQARASSRYSIIPFDGSTGTTRRPIYIECTDKAIRFLPEGVELTASDLLGFSTDDNPLLAGTQRLLHYWTAKARTSGNKDEPEPYVLLLVRPSGSVAYYAARKMLRNLNHPVGYELIEADWQLHLPPADPQAKAVCELAVDKALRGRRRVIASLAPDGGTSASEGGGGHGRMMRFNRATGRFEVVQDEDRPSLGPFGSMVDGGNGSRGTTGHGKSDGATAGTANAQRSAVGDQRSEVGGRRSHRPPSSDLRPPTGRFAGGANAGRNADGKTDPATHGRPGTPDGKSTTAGGDPKLWPLKDRQPGGTGIDPGTAGAVTGSKVNGNPTGKSGTNGDSEPDPFEKSNRGQRAATSSSGSQPPEQRGPRGSKSEDGASPGAGLFGGGGSPTNRFSPRRRWGYSSPNATIGFEREIDIAVTTDRLIVRGRQTFRVGQGETQDELVRLVATAVEREVRSWGKPPDSFYWVPTLRFVVSPGGNRHYERLKGPVKKLGLQAISEYRLDSPPVPTAR